MKRKTYILLLLLLALVLLAQDALAMSSAHYRLDWFTPATSNGGGPSVSAHYSADVTVGQVATGASSSSKYKSGLGYWYGLLSQVLFLPIIGR